MRLSYPRAKLPNVNTRYRYGIVGVHSQTLPYQPPAQGHKPHVQSQPPLAMMPTGPLLRSLLFTSIMSSPLLNPCLSMLTRVVNSTSPLLDPSQNPLMNHLLRMTIYNHFCAGENERSVQQTVHGIKTLGFKGVIMGYAKETVVKENESTTSSTSQEEASLRSVEEWKRGNLRTLGMIGAGDYLAVKYVSDYYIDCNRC